MLLEFDSKTHLFGNEALRIPLDSYRHSHLLGLHTPSVQTGIISALIDICRKFERKFRESSPKNWNFIENIMLVIVQLKQKLPSCYGENAISGIKAAKKCFKSLWET